MLKQTIRRGYQIEIVNGIDIRFCFAKYVKLFKVLPNWKNYKHVYKHAFKVNV